MKDLICKNPEMTAVFVTNYEMTMGAVIAVNELGIKVPDKLSLIGFDNLEFARACSPRLTIVSQPTEEIGREAAEIMLSRLKGEAAPPLICKTLQTEIIPGMSIKEI